MIILSSKICTQCKIEKSLNDFYPKKSHSTGRCPDCKECQKTRSKNFIKKNWDSRYRKIYQERALKQKFGITLQQFEFMLIEQGFKCLICEVHQSQLDRSLSVDHCHKTGKIRGLLCGKCNNFLGIINDDISKAQKVVDYLKKHNSI